MSDKKSFKDREAFTFYRSYYELAKEIPEEFKGEFYHALIEYQFTGKEPKFNGVLKLAWAGAKYAADKQVKGFKTYIDKGNQRTPSVDPSGDPSGVGGGVGGGVVDGVEGGDPSGDPISKYKYKGKNKNNGKNKSKTYLDLTPEDFLQEIKVLSEENKVFSVIGIHEFYNHWSEMTPKGKMKFQTQETWNTLMRMKKWASNNYSGKSKYGFMGNEFRNLAY